MEKQEIRRVGSTHSRAPTEASTNKHSALGDIEHAESIEHAQISFFLVLFLLLFDFSTFLL